MSHYEPFSTLSNNQARDPYIQYCQGYWFQLFGYAKEAKVKYSRLRVYSSLASFRCNRSVCPDVAIDTMQIAYTRALSVDSCKPRHCSNRYHACFPTLCLPVDWQSKSSTSPAACVDALWELGRIYLVEFQPDRTLLLWSRLMQERPDFPPLLRWLRDTEQQIQEQANNPAAAGPAPELNTSPNQLGPIAAVRAALTVMPAREDVHRLLAQLRTLQQGGKIDLPVISSAVSLASSSTAPPPVPPKAAALAAAMPSFNLASSPQAPQA